MNIETERDLEMAGALFMGAQMNRMAGYTDAHWREEIAHTIATARAEGAAEGRKGVVVNHQWWCQGKEPCACTDGWKEERRSTEGASPVDDRLEAWAHERGALNFLSALDDLDAMRVAVRNATLDLDILEGVRLIRELRVRCAQAIAGERAAIGEVAALHNQLVQLWPEPRGVEIKTDPRA